MKVARTVLNGESGGNAADLHNQIFKEERMKFLKLLKESIILALGSVMINKLRTFLTLSGITIGIFSIISVFTVLDWMEKSIRDSINSMGSNVLYIQKYPWTVGTSIKWWDIIRWPAVSLED